MNPARIAIPSTRPGGLDAGVGAHFGHAEGYTVVDVLDGRITGVTQVAGLAHEPGGCLAPVAHLAEHGVTVLIAAGMGLRPLMGFNQAGIEVFRCAGSPTVGDAVAAFLQGELPRFSRESTCASHSH